MSGSGQSRNDGRVQEISEITRGLKSIAKELNIPIIALSQLSRQVEQSHNIAELIIAKQRHGPIGTIKTQFDSNVTKFYNLAKNTYDQIE